ncbi:MAG: hypothetical protein ACI9EF_001300 [Pseudohongiellaceae bacterium]|jgi:hypothetical protein
MSFIQVSLLFLVQMAFGSMATFPLTDREALGPKYFKFGGWVLTALYGLALSLCGDAMFDDSALSIDRLSAFSVAIAAASLLAFSSLTGWDKPKLETLTLWIALVAGGTAVVTLAIAGLPAETANSVLSHDTMAALSITAALLSSLVLGFATWGMALGHWYLVAAGLPIKHLARLVTPLPWILGAKLVLSTSVLWLLWGNFLGAGNHTMVDVFERQPDRILDLVNVCSRIPVGLAIPFVLACMARVTVKMERTQPATGILYAMCVLVYMGDLMGKMIEGTSGIPM